MEKETIRIIAIHPENGLHVEVLELTSEDEDFLSEDDEFESFDDYVEYSVSESLNAYEQLGYIAISAKEGEVKDIINELSK